jgi:hypothetical protein
MRSVSSKRTAALAALAALCAALAGSAGSGVNPAPATPLRLDRATTPTLAAAGEQLLRQATWWGGQVTAATGEQLTVYVSDSYAADQSLPQHWADFFAGLVHGPELPLLTAYVATPAEVQQLCGSVDALGCYGGQRLIIMGEPFAGVDPQEVARHEYGHHVAANRVNPPWQSVDWGTKRWASAENVCARTAGATAFPGDEGDHYEQNPGEAFAETFRALNEAKAGATTFTWPIVDSTFYPDAAALQAVEQDVLQPWTAPTTRSIRVRLPKAKRVWTLRLATPLDGQLDVNVALPVGAIDDVSLLGGDGHVLAQGLWSGLHEKRVGYTICGQRSLLLRVVRKAAPTSFAVRVTQP